MSYGPGRASETLNPEPSKAPFIRALMVLNSGYLRYNPILLIRALLVIIVGIEGILEGSSQKLQYPLVKEYTLNHIKDPEYNLRYIPELRDSGVSGLAGLGEA